MNKPELDKLIICLCLLCGLQGGYLLILAGNCGPEAFNLILQGLDGLFEEIPKLADGQSDKLVA
jgi:hypothetical protein